MSDNTDVLQGTLDLLIMRTVALDRCMAGPSRSVSSRFQMTC